MNVENLDKGLGVESLAEGGKKLRVRPDLGDLTFIEGVVPTAYGDVKIRCDKKGANVEVKIDAPPQVEIIRVMGVHMAHKILN